MVQVTINSVNMMEWNGGNSFLHLFFPCCVLFLDLPLLECVISLHSSGNFHEHHQSGIGDKSCYAHILGGKIRQTEKMECAMAIIGGDISASIVKHTVQTRERGRQNSHFGNVSDLLYDLVSDQPMFCLHDECNTSYLVQPVHYLDYQHLIFQFMGH